MTVYLLEDISGKVFVLFKSSHSSSLFRKMFCQFSNFSIMSEFVTLSAMTSSVIHIIHQIEFKIEGFRSYGKIFFWPNSLVTWFENGKTRQSARDISICKTLKSFPVEIHGRKIHFSSVFPKINQFRENMFSRFWILTSVLIPQFTTLSEWLILFDLTKKNLQKKTNNY